MNPFRVRSSGVAPAEGAANTPATHAAARNQQRRDALASLGPTNGPPVSLEVFQQARNAIEEARGWRSSFHWPGSWDEKLSIAQTWSDFATRALERSRHPQTSPAEIESFLHLAEMGTSRGVTFSNSVELNFLAPPADRERAAGILSRLINLTDQIGASQDRFGFPRGERTSLMRANPHAPVVGARAQSMPAGRARAASQGARTNNEELTQTSRDKILKAIRDQEAAIEDLRNTDPKRPYDEASPFIPAEFALAVEITRWTQPKTPHAYETAMKLRFSDERADALLKAFIEGVE